MTKQVGVAAAAAFIATIFVANWLVTHVGIIDILPGPPVLLAPAGVLVVGVAFTLRDIVHRTLGVPFVIGAIVVGAVLSALVSPAFALASGVAFLFSEMSDLAVYQPLHRRSWLAAVALSNTVGLVVDSILFLWISPLPVHGLLAGQIVGKAYMTALAVIVIAAARAIPRPTEARA